MNTLMHFQLGVLCKGSIAFGASVRFILFVRLNVLPTQMATEVLLANVTVEEVFVKGRHMFGQCFVLGEFLKKQNFIKHSKSL